MSAHKVYTKNGMSSNDQLF